jgi:hypothetical protein
MVGGQEDRKMKNVASGVFALLAGIELVSGCAGAHDAGMSDVGMPDVGTSNGSDMTDVELALSTVPAGVQCVRVTVTTGSGTTLNPPLMTVAAGASSATLSVGQLPAGAATFNGAAFNAACSAVTGSTVANWIATPVMTTLSLGISNKVTMTFLPNNPVSVSANFITAPVELSLGTHSTRVRMADGTVREWGLLTNGAIATQPTAVSGLNDAVQIASGWWQMACARQAAGGVSCWGTAASWGGSGFAPTPVPIAIPTPVGAISIGQLYGCGSVLNRVYCWGANDSGAFANGSTGFVGAPAATGTFAPKVMSGVSHACLVGSDGGVVCSGDNTSGQLGLGNTTSTLLGFRVDGVTGTVDLAVGTFHTCALRGDGTVRCWGGNSRGQLGDGTTTQRTSPVQVVGINDAVRVLAGEEHTCVLRQTGTVSCWGKGTTLGDGLGLDRSTPADVPNLSGVTALDSHIGRHTCAILTDRTLKCWGENESAQVDGTQVWAAKPTTVVLQ